MTRPMLILMLAVTLTTAVPAMADPLPQYKPVSGLSSQFGDYRGWFETLTDPKVVPADAMTELNDDDEVLGLSFNGEYRAYPLRFIAWHHIVNDTIGGKPVLVSFCLVCNSGVAYDPVFDGKRHLFDVFGIYRGVLAMSDRDNQTLWSHLTGEALFGPDKGKSMEYISVVNLAWGEWKRLHHNTTTPAWDDAFREHYARPFRSGRAISPTAFPKR